MIIRLQWAELRSHVAVFLGMRQQLTVKDRDPLASVLSPVLLKPEEISLMVRCARGAMAEDLRRSQNLRPPLQPRLVNACAESFGDQPAGSADLVSLDVVANPLHVGGVVIISRNSGGSGHFVRVL
jgi:hypothetical protein